MSAGLSPILALNAAAEARLVVRDPECGRNLVAIRSYLWPSILCMCRRTSPRAQREARRDVLAQGSSFNTRRKHFIRGRTVIVEKNAAYERLGDLDCVAPSSFANSPGSVA
jgi:hypothetical protein